MLVLLIGSAAKAEVRKSGDIAKPAWEWTVDERLAQRFAPKAMEARAAEHAAEERAFLRRFPEAANDFPETKGTGSPQHDTDSIDGDKTPELFLPFELFDHLLNMGLTSGADLESRTIIEQRAVALGLAVTCGSGSKRQQLSTWSYSAKMNAERGHSSVPPGQWTVLRWITTPFIIVVLGRRL
jgi:hypothetical protein